MPRKSSRRSMLLVLAGLAASLVLGDPRTLPFDPSLAGTRIKAEKVRNFLILGAGLGSPTGVAMVNQVVPVFSPYSNPVVPFIDVLARTDLLVTTNANLSGLPPVAGFPEGAVVRVRRPMFPTSSSQPPDADKCLGGTCATGFNAGRACVSNANCVDGVSDNVALISENNNNFIFGNDPVVVRPGNNSVLNTNPARDDQVLGATITVGPDGVSESGRCGDDLQFNPVGNIGLTSTAAVVAAGPNGILESNPAGDDLVGPAGGCAGNTICAGPDGIAQSGRGGDDLQAIACIGRYLITTDIVLDGGANRLVQTPIQGDDVRVIVAAQDQTVSGGVSLDSDTTACQDPAGAAVPACDDVQLVAPGAAVANRNIAVVGPGANGALETPPNSGVLAGVDLDADTAACRAGGAPGGAPLSPCDDVQVYAVGTMGLSATTRVVAPGPDAILQTPARFVAFPGNRDAGSFDAQAVQAGADRTANTGPPADDDVQIVTALAALNQNVPPVSAPVGIESQVTMYPAVANRVDPIGNPANSGSVSFLSAGAFSVGSNGDGLPVGDSMLLPAGLASPGPWSIGVFSGAEAAREGSRGLLGGLAGFTYGGFGWTDLSFKRPGIPQLPPDLKDQVYYATRNDGAIVLIHYRRGRVNDVLAPGMLDDPTDLAFLAPGRALCIGSNLDGGAGIAARCGPQDPPGTDAGRLYVIESGTGRIAIVPLRIANVAADFGLCANLTGASGLNPESGQGDFCDPKTGRRVSGGACQSAGTCHDTGVGLPNTRIVAAESEIAWLAPPFVTRPVAIAMATNAPVPHLGRITSGPDGISDTGRCNPDPPGSCDDIQVVPVGRGFPNTREVDTPVLGGFTIRTMPRGDDVLIGGVTLEVPQIPGGTPPTTITTGPDGIADTPACFPDSPGSCQDIQNIPLGRGEPFQRVIEAGPNGVLDTTAQGDDRVVGSPTLLVANADGTIVWMDLNGNDPIAHDGPPRLFRSPLTNITGMALGDFVNGEGIQVLLTTTDFDGAVVSFDLTLSDNSPSLAATLQILTDLNDTVSAKLDPTQVPIALPNPTRPTGLSHVALDYYPGPDGFIGTPDDPHFNDPNASGDISNISSSMLSEPNEIPLQGQGPQIYDTGGCCGPRQVFVTGGSFSASTLNAPFDGLLDNDLTTDLYNFVTGRIAIDVGRFPGANNAILAGSDGVVQTTVCRTPGGAPIPHCDDIQLTTAGGKVFTGPRDGKILAGPNGVAQSGIGGDDVQLQPVGRVFGEPGITSAGVPYTVWTANVAAVGAGANGVLDTCPGGDDAVGLDSAGIAALCPNVVPDLSQCPGEFLARGIGCTVPTPACPANQLCTGPNGVVNTGLGADDIQLVKPGAAGLAPSVPIVAAGPDGFVETSPGGDDALGGGRAIDIVIEPGSDGILQTPPAPGDVGARLTPLSVMDLDLYSPTRPVGSNRTPTSSYTFLDPAGANSGVVDINSGRTSSALDAAVDGIFPNSSSFFGPSYESPTCEIDFLVRNISLTATADNVTGLVLGRGVDRNSRLPALSLVYLDSLLSPLNNAFVGSAIVGRQFIRAPHANFQEDRILKARSKRSK